MEYKILYVTDNGKKLFSRITAQSEKDAKEKLMHKYHDIKEIVQIIS